jgi:hypothetical protein
VLKASRSNVKLSAIKVFESEKKKKFTASSDEIKNFLPSVPPSHLPAGDILHHPVSATSQSFQTGS